jgi:hypothetical protein
MPFVSTNGLKLAKAFGDRWLPIAIILVSGHKFPESQNLPLGVRFFPIPYEEETIVATIFETVEGA